MSLFLIELVIFILSVFLAGLITAGEIALSSFGENKIEELKERGDAIWQKFYTIHHNPEPYYGTIHLLYLTFIISSVVFGFLLSAKLINPGITEPRVGFYDDSIRYAVVVVELDCGVRMISDVVDCPAHEVAIGMPVEVAFEDRSPEVTLPVFRRRAGPARS